MTNISLTDLVHDPETRLGRAVLLVEEHGNEIERISGDWYRVPASDGGYYRVRYGSEEGCNCLDFAYHGEEGACKHILAVGIHLAKRRTRGARSCFCDACGRVSGELYEVQEEDEDFSHFLAGERLCRSCARRGGVL